LRRVERLLIRRVHVRCRLVHHCAMVLTVVSVLVIVFHKGLPSQLP
jgi:hypothetical protein